MSGRPGQSGSRPGALGVDGWQGSWVGAEVGADAGHGPATVRWHTGPLDAMVAAVPTGTVVAVDIPIGLPSSGRRRCDVDGRAALATLTGAPSRLFLAPPAWAYAARDYPAALAALAAAGEPGMSKQTWALRAAVDAAERVRRGGTDLVEVHPELSYLAMSGAVLPPKRTAAGVGARVRALAGWTDVPAALATCPAGVPVDDALDALAAAWTASRVRDGCAGWYPADPAAGEPVIRA